MPLKRIVLDVDEEIERKIEANKKRKFIRATSQYLISLVVADSPKENDQK